jgi:hypothetical protein
LKCTLHTLPYSSAPLYCTVLCELTLCELRNVQAYLDNNLCMILQLRPFIVSTCIGCLSKD